MSRIFPLALILSLLIAPVSWAQKPVKEKDFSGYLENYDKLVFSDEINAFVFFNEEKRGQYSRIMIDSVTIYSERAEANEELAAQAAEYMRKGGEAILEERGIKATEPGPGVLRYKMAITGAEKSKESLKAHNLIPVSALFRGAQAATGNVATYIDVMFEAEMVDSQSGERAAAIVRRGIGETEKRSGDELTFDDLVPTLDLWLGAWAGTVDAFLAKRAE